jgi:hypothetical protein
MGCIFGPSGNSVQTAKCISKKEISMTVAAVLFAIAALGGLALAGLRLSGRPLPPMWLAVVHGLAAATGLILLIMAVTGSTVPAPVRWALGLFIVAALGGFALFSFHLRGRALPVPLMIVHGLAAVISFVLLLLGIFAASA